ncbi:hypothetical protein PR003_g20881 [Phytophthora rubi]|uniref:Uncharacterized protein n=2 Tax=Phytophthora rubi TaxID=129364 RepID=A0A6A4DM72_9STRA|nr:hypothetical protein PR003_g20881 [Phytophthora rubi]
MDSAFLVATEEFLLEYEAEGEDEFEDLYWYSNEHASVNEAGRPTTVLESYARLQPLGLDAGGNSRGGRFVKLLAQVDAQKTWTASVKRCDERPLP